MEERPSNGNRIESKQTGFPITRRETEREIQMSKINKAVGPRKTAS